MPNPEPAFRFGFPAIRDALLIVHETKDLGAWGGMGFIIWHTGYFSICVWMALFLMTGPRLSKIAKADTMVLGIGDAGDQPFGSLKTDE
jgi:hypothetical protein